MNLKNLWPFHASDALAVPAQAAISQSSSASLQAVFSSYSAIEAHIISGMLEDNGINCVLSNELFAAADGPVANATGGVQVFVREADADQARALIRDADAPEDDEAI